MALTKSAWQARKMGDRESAQHYNQLAQRIPSRDPNDPNFHRLWYCRYADDFWLGYVGSESEAEDNKHQITTFLRDTLSLELSQEKALITHAKTEKTHFLGYEVHTLYADSKHDYRGSDVSMEALDFGYHGKSSKRIVRTTHGVENQST